MGKQNLCLSLSIQQYINLSYLFIYYLFIFANEQLWLLYLYQEDSKDISKVQNIIFILTAKENLTTFDLLDLELLNSMAAYDIVTTFPTQFDIWFLVQGVVNKLH